MDLLEKAGHRRAQFRSDGRAKLKGPARPVLYFHETQDGREAS
jgi:hypothetical protein